MIKLFRKTLFPCFSFLLFFIACASTPPPLVTNTSNVGISLSLYQDVHAQFNSIEFFVPEKVYFIKFDNDLDHELKDDHLYASNYKYDGFLADDGVVFALNLPAGEYAPVAAYGHALKNIDNKFMVFFPKALIEKTRTKITPGTIVYLGQLYLKTVSTMKGADAVQLYYYSIFSGKEKSDGFWIASFKRSFFSSNLSFVAPYYQGVANSPGLQAAFLKKYRSYFENTQWEGFFTKRLEEIGK